MPMSRLSTEALDQIAENGYAIVPDCLDALTLCEFSDLLDAGNAGARNLLDVPAIRRLCRLKCCTQTDGASARFELLRGSWHSLQ
jgi:hypothetical protein